MTHDESQKLRAEKDGSKVKIWMSFVSIALAHFGEDFTNSWGLLALFLSGYFLHKQGGS